ncbi:MAG TPA: hypothetical protein VGK73_31480 [Polyangiaceae bacterium]
MTISPKNQRGLARLREMADAIGELPTWMLAIGQHCPRCPHEALTPWERYEIGKAELEGAGLSAEEYEARLAELVEELGV